MEKTLLAVGNYSNSIKIFEWMGDSLKLVNEEKGIENPSYIAVDNNRKFLLAASEIEEENGSLISSYAIDRDSKGLILLDRQPTFGSASCHIAISLDNTRVLVSNYGSGTTSSFILEKDGKLKFVELIKNEGELLSKNSRQSSPHAHGAFFYEKGFFSVDLGLDKALFYEFNQQGEAEYRPEKSLSTKLGNGPRHMELLDGYAYVLGELGNEITVFELEKDTSPKMVSVVSTLPKGFLGESFAGAILFSEDKKTLYCTNRGDDSFAFFNVLKGQMDLIGIAKTNGSFPRDFLILNDEKFFVFANQYSDALAVIKNTGDGEYSCVFQEKTPSPSCVAVM